MSTLLLELLPIAVLGAVLGLDVVGFPQAMISRPLVAATLGGALVGNAAAGLLLGALLELFALETLPFGASRYPEWGSAAAAAGALVRRRSVRGRWVRSRSACCSPSPSRSSAVSPWSGCAG